MPGLRGETETFAAPAHTGNHLYRKVNSEDGRVQDPIRMVIKVVHREQTSGGVSIAISWDIYLVFVQIKGLTTQR